MSAGPPDDEGDETFVITCPTCDASVAVTHLLETQARGRVAELIKIRSRNRANDPYCLDL